MQRGVALRVPRGDQARVNAQPFLECVEVSDPARCPNLRIGVHSNRDSRRLHKREGRDGHYERRDAGVGATHIHAEKLHANRDEDIMKRHILH